jgi:hypothetical protein
VPLLISFLPLPSLPPKNPLRSNSNASTCEHSLSLDQNSSLLPLSCSWLVACPILD